MIAGALGNASTDFEPAGRRVDFFERKTGVEQFADDFFALDHEEPEFFPMLFIAERTKALDIGLGEHDESLQRVQVFRNETVSEIAGEASGRVLAVRLRRFRY